MRRSTTNPAYVLVLLAAVGCASGSGGSSGGGSSLSEAETLEQRAALLRQEADSKAREAQEARDQMGVTDPAGQGALRTRERQLNSEAEQLRNEAEGLERQAAELRREAEEEEAATRTTMPAPTRLDPPSTPAPRPAPY